MRPSVSSAGGGWDAEYERAGIPSSFRDEPSSTVVWALDSWTRANGGAAPRRVLDVGCGTARNAVQLARQGARVTGFDASAVAIERGRERVRQAALDGDVELLVHDLSDGLPAGDGEIDLVLDVFVYKHQLQPRARRRYRAELLRVLAPHGRVLLSLAEPDDGYYGSCPRSDEPGAGPHAVVDPAVGAGSVLFTLGELEAEMGDAFALELAWRKRGIGEMHGREHVRRTLATLWRPGTA
jgi:SAM-dependent methyltransferase